MNPYEVLGLKRTEVTKAAVNSAFKAKLSETHPDHEGGSAEKMTELNMARDILLNPERRRRFDELGSTSSGSLSIQEQAQMVLGNIFAQAIEQLGDEPVHMIFANIAAEVAKGLDRALEFKANHPRRLRQATKALKRIKSCDPFLRNALEAKLAKLESLTAENNQQIELGNYMLKLMATIRFTSEY